MCHGCLLCAGMIETHVQQGPVQKNTPKCQGSTEVWGKCVCACVLDRFVVGFEKVQALWGHTTVTRNKEKEGEEEIDRD